MNKFFFSKLIACGMLVISCGITQAQTDNDQEIAVLRNVIPPSPNSSSLGKYGEWPVGLYTGVPNISIPVCNLKGRTVSVPVTLSYHAAGNKVGDIPSWVGLGWSLSAGGTVTRSIRGLPDEYSYFDNASNYVNPNDYSSAPINQNQLSLTIVTSAKNNTDTQEDVYSFNALGKSYKLILKPDGTMQTIPASSVKLIGNPIAGTNRTSESWIILLEDGTKLLFGGGMNFTEITSDPHFPGGDGQGITFVSSWMLQSITTTSNEVISFTYSTVGFDQDSYYSQSDWIQFKTSFYGGGAPPTSCPNITRSPSIKSTVTNQHVVSLNLATIESDLGRVDFITNSADRTDLPGSKALQEIKLFSKSENKYIEDYILTTSYSTAVNSNVLTTAATVNDTYTNYRLRLNSLEKKDLNNPTSLGQKWTFDYNSQNLPARRSFAQDHWGFFNGATSNTTLLPQVNYSVSSFYLPPGLNPADLTFDPWGNREANENYLQAEMLTSIHYPTGGYTNFTYEANSIVVTEETFSNTPLHLYLHMSAEDQTSNSSTAPFTITKPQYVRLSAYTYISDDIDQTNAHITTQILNQSGTIIANLSGTNSDVFNLIAAGTYTLKVSTNVLPGSLAGANLISADVTLRYDESNGEQTFNKLVGGLRIKKIADYDGITSSGINERSFTYESPLEINPVDIENDYLTSQGLETKNSSPISGEVCSYTVVTRNSSSKYALGSIQGGTVAYGKVTTLYGPNGSNGMTVSLFTNDPDQGVAAAKVFPYPTSDSRDHRRGLLLEETQYKSDLTTILKKTINTYSFNTIGYVTGFKAGYSLKFLDPTLCLNTFGLCGITTRFVTTTTEQVKHLTSTVITNDQNGQNPLTVTTNYFYDNPNNFQPVRIETTDSKNNLVKTYVRTALEKADINTATPLLANASTAIDAMVAANMVSQVIQQEKQNAGSLVARSLINYKLWDNNILLPETIDVQNGTNDKETRIKFTSYDSKGNLLSQQKASDVSHSYIYDYSSTYAIAEAMNASPSDITYTSFEADGTGNWNNYVGTITTVTPDASRSNMPPTGNKYYNITPTSTLSKTVTNGNKYIISYWSKNGVYTINGGMGTYKTGRALNNGWTYYEHAITASSTTLTISGTGAIDEVRLYPDGAQMTTYTYDPLTGITSQCDVNNRISYYEYDGMGRLTLVRDQDKNIIKKICYNYLGQAENCN